MWGPNVIASRVRIAASPLARMRGLAMKPGMAANEGLILEPASQIHTFGMRFSIDVIFCDRDWNIVHVVRNVKPNRMTRWVRGARRVIELSAGSLPQGLAVGDRLELDQGTSSSPVR